MFRFGRLSLTILSVLFCATLIQTQSASAFQIRDPETGNQPAKNGGIAYYVDDSKDGAKGFAHSKQGMLVDSEFQAQSLQPPALDEQTNVPATVRTTVAAKSSARQQTFFAPRSLKSFFAKKDAENASQVEPTAFISSEPQAIVELPAVVESVEDVDRVWTESAVGPVSEAAYRRDNFFGIDRNCCCDEWADYCPCGGLKAKPGHLGIPWLVGRDPCEYGETWLSRMRLPRGMRPECTNCQP